MGSIDSPQREPPVFTDRTQLYRLLAETIPLMVWTADAKGGVEFVNRRVLEYTGLAALEIEGEGWERVVHPDDRRRTRDTWERGLSSGERFENDMRLRGADGAYRWHHGSGVALRGADGRIERWFGVCTDIEDRIRSEHLLESLVQARTRELREAQRRLGAIIETEPECVKMLDTGGHLLEMNAAGLRMIEAEPGDGVFGRPVYPLIVEEHRAAFRDLTERVCRGERGTLQFEIVGLKGTRRWLETHAAPFREEASGETRLLAVTRDITDRKRAEEALRASEQRFEMFLDQLPVLAWIRDADLRYSYVNRQYERRFGTSREEMIGRDSAPFYPPEANNAFREADLKVQAEGQPIQYFDSRPTGHWLKVRFPFPDARGRTGAAGIAIDITEQHRLEQRLTESERRFGAFMDNLPALAWIKDAAFRYTYLNRAGPNGRVPEAVIGRDDSALWPAETARRFRESDEAALRAAGRPVQSVQTTPLSDGRAAHALVVKFALPAAAGGGASIGGIAIDLTERIEAERQAERYAKEIRGLMDRLVTAQESERRRVAGDLHDLIGQNLTALGIDLKALKQRLGSAGDLIAGPRLDAMAGVLETTIDAIRGVMTELRPVALEEFGLEPALRWYAASFAQRTGMRISTRVSGGESRLSPERELALFRVVQEALTNAAKHSGGHAVEISVERDEHRLVVTVADDGHGFGEKPEAPDKRHGGWGLTAMRERAEAHGGRLRVESSSAGTRVSVEIPLDDAG